jgi:hypothetical protein
MFIKTLALSTAIALCGGAALADGLAQATLQSPIAKPTQFVAAGAVWTCQGSTCVAPVDKYGDSYTEVFTVFGCEDLVRLVGPIATYNRDGKTFTSGQLDSCNKIAPKTGGVQTAAAH